MELHFEKMLKYAPYFEKGMFYTIVLSAFSVAIGFALALVVALIRLSKPGKSTFSKVVNKAMHIITGLYIEVVRGTPLLVQVMIVNLVVFHPDLIPKPKFTIFGTITGELFVPALVAISLNSGAYVAEIIRGGIMSIDAGQMEAGRSLGFGYVSTMRYIILPQAFKAVLPTLANEFIVLLKETAVAGYVGLTDVTYAGNIIGGNCYDYLFPLLMSALIYLILVMFFTFLVGKLERRLRSSER